jgi:hypothetical protein
MFWGNLRWQGKCEDQHEKRETFNAGIENHGKKTFPHPDFARLLGKAALRNRVIAFF